MAGVPLELVQPPATPLVRFRPASATRTGATVEAAAKGSRAMPPTVGDIRSTNGTAIPASNAPKAKSIALVELMKTVDLLPFRAEP